MQSQLKIVAQHQDDRRALEEKLKAAHQRIETNFLAGGAVLVSIMEILNRLVSLLDRLTGTLDGDTTSGTIAGLQKTIADLAQLPGIEEKRQSTFSELSGVCMSTGRHVDDMRETIRYLRTFAITVKITGAGLSGFAEFADEIRERIQSGANEVDRFSGHLGQMRAKLDSARRFSTTILTDFNATIPRIVADLTTSSSQLSLQHRQMTEIAAQVKTVARGVETKIATVLSALQIGDITRQRIEHIQSTLELFDDFALTQTMAQTTLDDAAIDALRETIFHLCNAQLNETVNEFQKDCRSIFTNISRFARDAGDILALHETFGRKVGTKDGNVLRMMETTIADACRLVVRVEGSSREADDVVQSVIKTADDLLQGIEVIRAIKTDIHYMALNSNLRCSRLGDEGRAVNVVSGELRNFAGKLEVPADATVTELRRVDTAAQILASEDGVAVGDTSRPLNDALDAIRKVCVEMEAGLEDFSGEGQEVYTRISSAISTLDFQTELGGVLGECVALSQSLAGNRLADISDLADVIAPLSAQIFGIYTMAQERAIHLKFLEVGALHAVAATVTKEDATDDDLFADALF